MRLTDPNFPIIFDRTQEELEENLLFCVVVAGKKASTQIRLLHSFLNSGTPGLSPFDKIRAMNSDGSLSKKLMESRLGQYTRLVCCFRALISSDINLSNCTVEDLESIHGIGPKTARFFMTCNRADVRHAVIDTHNLRFLREVIGENTPSTTPQSHKEYNRLETRYLQIADVLGVNPSDFDLAIWKSYSHGNPSFFEDFIKKAGVDRMFIKNTANGAIKLRFVQNGLS